MARGAIGRPEDQSVATKKLSITLAADVAHDVERLAQERGLAVSAWLTEAAQAARRHHAAPAAIAEYEAESATSPRPSWPMPERVWPVWTPPRRPRDDVRGVMPPRRRSAPAVPIAYDAGALVAADKSDLRCGPS
jgi:hypothetical protein